MSNLHVGQYCFDSNGRAIDVFKSDYDILFVDEAHRLRRND